MFSPTVPQTAAFIPDGSDWKGGRHLSGNSLPFCKDEIQPVVPNPAQEKVSAYYELFCGCSLTGSKCADLLISGNRCAARGENLSYKDPLYGVVVSC